MSVFYAALAMFTVFLIAAVLMIVVTPNLENPTIGPRSPDA